MHTIAVIIGSTRHDRVADHPARWVAEHLRRQPDAVRATGGEPGSDVLPGLQPKLDTMTTDLLWWTGALGKARR